MKFSKNLTFATAVSAIAYVVYFFYNLINLIETPKLIYFLNIVIFGFVAVVFNVLVKYCTALEDEINKTNKKVDDLLKEIHKEN